MLKGRHKITYNPVYIVNTILDVRMSGSTLGSIFVLFVHCVSNPYFRITSATLMICACKEQSLTNVRHNFSRTTISAETLRYAEILLFKKIVYFLYIRDWYATDGEHSRKKTFCLHLKQCYINYWKRKYIILFITCKYFENEWELIYDIVYIRHKFVVL